jgi:hypothetical protein
MYLAERFRIFFTYRARGQILLVIAEIFLLATVDPCPRDGNSFAVALRSSQRDWHGEGTGAQDEPPSYSCSLCRVQTASIVPLGWSPG